MLSALSGKCWPVFFGWKNRCEGAGGIGNLNSCSFSCACETNGNGAIRESSIELTELNTTETLAIPKFMGGEKNTRCLEEGK